MNKFFIIPCLLLCFSNVKAESCHFTLSSSSVEWTAYKTPKKVGVKGSFNKLEIKTKKDQSDSIEMAIQGARFMADSASVNTENPDRDQKIVNSFFIKKNKAVEISGNVKSVKKDKVEVEFNINGNKKVIPMNLAIQGTNATLTGSIDVMDFLMGENLAALTKACYDLHEGKTWSTVDLSLAAQFTKNCK